MNNARKYDVICTGTAIVDSIIRGFDREPISAANFRAEEGSLNAGGEAVNEACAAAKLGLSAGILCFLGNDAAAGIILDALAKSGADTGLIVRSDEHPTPITTMFVAEDGTRRSITNRAHRYNFHPEKYTSCFYDAKAVILGSLFRPPFNEPEIIEKVLKDAKAAGALIFADTKVPNFNVLSLGDLSECLPLADYITPNEDEARYYSGKEDPDEMADVFLSYGVKNVIIKLGSKGCFFKNPKMSLYLPAYRIPVKDATGAGDNFIAGFASEILRGSSHEEALRFANACGAVCTTMSGAGTALKSREQILEFMLSNRPGAETEEVLI